MFQLLTCEFQSRHCSETLRVSVMILGRPLRNIENLGLEGGDVAQNHDQMKCE